MSLIKPIILLHTVLCCRTTTNHHTRLKNHVHVHVCECFSMMSYVGSISSTRLFWAELIMQLNFCCYYIWTCCFFFIFTVQWNVNAVQNFFFFFFFALYHVVEVAHKLKFVFCWPRSRQNSFILSIIKLYVLRQIFCVSWSFVYLFFLVYKYKHTILIKLNA